MFSLFFLILLAGPFAFAQFPSTACQIDGSDYGQFFSANVPDLTFSTTDECGNANANYQYTVAICRSTNTGCGTENGFYCQSDNNKAEALSASATGSSLVGGGFSITGYKGASPTTGDSGTINVYCPANPNAPAGITTLNPSAPTAAMFVSTAAQNSNNACDVHTVSVAHPSACPGVAPKVTSSSSKDHGLSGGWVFCIILFCVVPVYFMAGCGWNYHKGSRSCSELTPNYSFWAAIPGLMKDGTVFSINKIKGLFGGKPTGTYETL